MFRDGSVFVHFLFRNERNALRVCGMTGRNAKLFLKRWRGRICFRMAAPLRLLRNWVGFLQEPRIRRLFRQKDCNGSMSRVSKGSFSRSVGRSAILKLSGFRLSPERRRCITPWTPAKTGVQGCAPTLVEKHFLRLRRR